MAVYGNTQNGLHLIFGTLIQKCLDVQVAGLTHQEYSTSSFLRSPSGMVEFRIKYPQSVSTQEQKVTAEK